MIRRIYHGSDHIIEVPIFGKGRSANDYGRGFYCTEHLELAKEWACAKNTDGYANCYELELSELSVLSLNGPEYSILNWLAVLSRYRSYWQEKSIAEEAKEYLQEHFFVDLQGYDVIVGYRADDSYFSFAQDFVMGAISLQQLQEAMYLGRLGEQLVLKSQKAFDQLRYVGSEEALAQEYFLKKTQRDRMARQQYRQTRQRTMLSQDIYMIDIIRRGLTNDELRL